MEVRREIVLPTTREDAWEALTEPSRLEEWFATEVELDLREGGAAVFRWGDGDARRARVVTVDDEERLVLHFEDDGVVDLRLVSCELDELGLAAFHHLGHPVENLAAVVGSHARPLRKGLAGGADGIPEVLAGGEGDVRPLGLIGATGFGARERAADVELVGLLDRKPGHSSNSRYGARPWRPPSRPKPDSL